MGTRMEQLETTGGGAGPCTNLRKAAPTLWCEFVLVANLLDALFTLTFLQLEVAYEVNPLMRWAYQSSPLSFMVTKLAMVQLGVMLLVHNRHTRASQAAEAFGGLLYCGILLYHVFCAAQLPVLVASG